MYLVKTKRSPFYQIIFDDEGKKRTLSTKKSKKAEALKFLSEFKNHLEKEKFIKPLTLIEFRNEYIPYIEATKSTGYYENVKLAFKMFIEFAGNLKLKKVDSRIVEKFIQSRKSKYACDGYYRTLKASFNTAIRWNYLESNPFVKVKPPKLPKKLPIFIMQDEINKILEHIESPTIKVMVLLSYETGMRLGEVVNLRWKNIDLQQKIIHVSNSDSFQTKSKQDRVIPLTNRLYKELVAIAPNIFKLRDNNHLVFLSKNKVKFNQDYVSKKFKKATVELKLNDRYKFHSLRHSFATNLVNSGASLFIVSKLLGHQDLKTTQIYSHLQPKNLFEAINLLNKAEGM